MWKVTVTWKKGDPVQVKRLRTHGGLKTYLDNEVFCLRHGCPLPAEVLIERTR